MSGQVGHCNSDERIALQGLSHEARSLYLLELRFFADAEGVTGVNRRHSYQSFTEELTVVKDKGSRRDFPPVTEKKIRSVLDELERHGLIERLPEKGKLVFRLPKAAQDKSVQNLRGGGRAGKMVKERRDEGRDEGRVETIAAQGKELFEGREDGRDEGQTKKNEISEEGRTSPITINTTTTAREAEIFQEQADTRRMFAMTLDWQPGTGFLKERSGYGFNPELLTNEVITEFAGYWSARPENNTQGMWEHMLAQRLKDVAKKAPMMKSEGVRQNRPPISQNAGATPSFPIFEPEPRAKASPEEIESRRTELRKLRGLPS